MKVQRGGGDCVARSNLRSTLSLSLLRFKGVIGRESRVEKLIVCSLGVQQSKLFKGFDSTLHFFFNFTGLRYVLFF